MRALVDADRAEYHAAQAQFRSGSNALSMLFALPSANTASTQDYARTLGVDQDRALKRAEDAQSRLSQNGRDLTRAEAVSLGYDRAATGLRLALMLAFAGLLASGRRLAVAGGLVGAAAAAFGVWTWFSGG